MSQATPESTSPQPGAEPAPRRRADDQEEVYYQGPPSLRGHLKPLFTWGFSGLLLIAAPIAMFLLSHRKIPRPWVAMTAAAVGLAMIYTPILGTRSIRYRISNFRVDWERGVLSKSIDTVELWQLADLKFHQTLMQRILGVGTIELFTVDARTPVVTLSAVPRARQIFDKLKQRVITVKAQHGVISIPSPGTPGEG